MSVASHNRVRVIAGNCKDGSSHLVEQLADFQIQDTHIHTAYGCIKVITRTSCVLLTADFNSDFAGLSSFRD